MNRLVDITLPYVEKNSQRDGSSRYYLRIAGKRICRLPNNPQSPEFTREYWAARERHEFEHAEAKATGISGPLVSVATKANSFKSLTLEYMRSDAFQMLDETTQAKRRAIMESMWVEPIKAGSNRMFADIPLSSLTITHIEILRDRKKETPFAADERLKILRQVFATTREGKEITPNIALAVRPFRKQTEGHHTITSDEIKQYIEHHGVNSKAVLAISILMFTGIRVSDLAAIGPQHRRKDAFKLRLFKNRNRKPVVLNIPIHPILDAVLKLHPAPRMNYLTTEFGKAFTIKGLGNRVSDWFTQAGLPHCTAHSVRKGLATEQAENGATDSMLEAMFGWSDGKTSKIYTRNASQARLATLAVAQIRWDGIGETMVPSSNDDE